MILAIAILVAMACVGASARRLWMVANPTALHPDDVVAFVGKTADVTAIARLRERLAEIPEADWERDLLDALGASRADDRVALLNEQLTELDLRIKRWEQVPRVCASIATSVGIVLGLWVLKNGFVNAPDLSSELGGRFVRSFVDDAMTVAAFAIIGTAFCLAAQAQARGLMRAHAAAADRMVKRLATF